MPIDTAVYIRVSTEEQNLGSQNAEVEIWLRNHGYSPDRVEWLSDKASGKTMRGRPGLEALRAGAFSGRYKTIVVWKIDRLSRSLRDGIELLYSFCDSGVRFVSVTQQLDLSGVMGKMMAVLLLGLAEIERENIHERTLAGVRVAKAAGKFKGSKAGRISAATKAKLPAIRNLIARGVTSPFAIGKAVGLSYHTIQKLMQNPQARLGGTINPAGTLTEPAPAPSPSSSAPGPGVPAA